MSSAFFWIIAAAIALALADVAPEIVNGLLLLVLGGLVVKNGAALSAIAQSSQQKS